MASLPLPDAPSLDSDAAGPHGSSGAQAVTPLLTALVAESRRANAMFCCPGHKRGNAAPLPMVQAFARQPDASPALFRMDLPELPALDNLFAPEAVLADAQSLAADVFGLGRDKSRSFFLVNGSTSGVIAAVTAAVASLRLPSGQPSTLILPRTAHQSAIHALVIAGSCPLFISPTYDQARDLVHPVSAPEVRRALAQAATENSPVAAVLIISPTYHGVVADVAAIAQECAAASVPLIVDEAHGAHLACDKASDSPLPPSAVLAGADIVIQSTHKTLGALTQASMLHWRKDALSGRGIGERELSRSLQLVQSTSPSNILMSSLDAARWQVAHYGPRMVRLATRLADKARERIQKIRGLDVLEKSALPNGFSWDPTRLVVIIDTDLMRRGTTGFDFDDSLIDDFGVYCELPALRHLTFIISAGNTEEDISTLVEALQAVASRVFTAQPDAGGIPRIMGLPPPMVQASTSRREVSPRAAFFGRKVSVSLDDLSNPAVGAICACVVCPYPPGIPVLLPGEPVSRAALDFLRKVEAVGGTVTGLDGDRCFDVCD